MVWPRPRTEPSYASTRLRTCRMGYNHIAAPHAAAIQVFYEAYFNPYLNFHRPCAVPEQIVDAKGKVKRRYRWYDALGDSAAVARFDCPSQARCSHSGSGAHSAGKDGHAGGHGDANRQTEAV